LVTWRKKALMRKLVLISLVLLTGYTTTVSAAQGNNLFDDPALEQAAIALVQDYLSGQGNGDGYQTASSRYGKGVEIFNSVDAYSLESIGMESGVPCMNVRIKATNGLGASIWDSYMIRFDYSPELRAQNDQYQGLRIKDFGSLGNRFMKGFRSNL